MRSGLALAAAALACVAAVVANENGDADIVPFFVILTLLGGIAAWATHPPFAGARRLVARATAAIWVVSALWAALLLLFFAGMGDGGSPTPGSNYLGIPVTAYHAIGLYVGALFISVAGLAPDRWFARRSPEQRSA